MDERKKSADELSPDTVEEYFSGSAEVAFPLSAELDARMEIEPREARMRLVLPASGAEPDVTAYERISIERINIVGMPGDWYSLAVDAEGMHYEAYTLIVSIVDQLEGGSSLPHAVAQSLSGLKDLLKSRHTLTPEKEAGLVGELLVLRHVLDELGEEAGLETWRGPDAEEHDFGFAAFDAEVKTTRSEKRDHRIGSESQLDPTPERPLYLVSVQITLAGTGSDAFTLPELVTDVRKRIDRGRPRFDAALRALGWRDEAADLYRSRFVSRSTPRAYLVDPRFPAVTGDRLDRAVPQRTLISGVTYNVDVSRLPHEQPPRPLTRFCEEPQ